MQQSAQRSNKESAEYNSKSMQEFTSAKVIVAHSHAQSVHNNAEQHSGSAQRVAQSHPNAILLSSTAQRAQRDAKGAKGKGSTKVKKSQC